MSPRTSEQVRNRSSARKAAAERKAAADAKRRERDTVELDLGEAFEIAAGAREQARDAEATAELRMGQVVDRLVGELSTPYGRAVELLGPGEQELRRLRKAYTDSLEAAPVPSAGHGTPPVDRPPAAAPTEPASPVEAEGEVRRVG